MLAWSVIAHGAALSAALAVVLVLLLAKQRQPAVLATVALGALVGPVSWYAILRATHADQLFSWQDTGSGVFTLAALSLLLGFGPLRTSPGQRVARVATVAALATLLVDIYLY
jgi:hypothetical protein